MFSRFAPLILIMLCGFSPHNGMTEGMKIIINPSMDINAFYLLAAGGHALLFFITR
jgi:hypothetical protein